MNRQRSLEDDLHNSLNQFVEFFLRAQQNDGTWRFCFENGTIIDAYMIILLRAIHYPDETIIQRLHRRIVKEQQANGSWALYRDEENGNLAATIDNVLALLHSGYSQLEDENIVKAKQYILSQGGITNTKGLLSKTMLAITGQLPWPDSISAIPMEIVLLPTYLPANLYEFSGYSRIHLIPMLIMAKMDFRISSPVQLDDLIVSNSNRTDEIDLTSEFHHMQLSIDAGRNRLLGTSLHDIAKEKAVQFMLDRIEADGTLYSYASSTILMIFSLLAMGFDSQHPRIIKAIEGLLDMQCISASQELTIQNSLLRYGIQH